MSKKTDTPVEETQIEEPQAVETTPEVGAEALEETEAEKPAKKTKAGPKSHRAVEKPAKAEQPVGTPKLPHSKKYREVAAKIEAGKLYPLAEAIALAQQTSIAKFDAAVELHVRLNQEARGSLKFPHSTGKAVRVGVVSEEVMAELAKGEINYDVFITTPALMPQLAKFARLLGPKGLMPNPKSGTITEDIEKVKAELEAGRLEYRSDSGNNVHIVVGRVSQPAEDIVENAQTVLDSMVSWGLKSAVVATTMGPGIKIELKG